MCIRDSPYSYWVTNESYEDEFRGLYKFGSDQFESSWIIKIFNLDTNSLDYDTRNNFISKTFLGNIPYIIFGNFFLLSLLAIIIYFVRREYIKFRSKYTIKIEDPKNIEKQQNEFLIKLEKAYREGLITEEEYHRKVSENNKIQEVYPKERHIEKSAEEKIDEEKEKFRKLHSDGWITKDEMEEKFKQIEKFHQLNN